MFASGVRGDYAEVMRGVYGASAFENGSNGCVCELACCVVSVDDVVGVM